MIRRATRGDVETIASVLYAAFVEYQARYTVAAFAATVQSEAGILARLDEGPVWLAVADSIAVGTVAAVSRDDLIVRGMAVLPGARGGGIGRRLLAVAEQHAIAGGHRRLLLDTTPFLVEAIRLYERAGFARIGERDLHGTPLITMERIIVTPA